MNKFVAITLIAAASMSLASCADRIASAGSVAKPIEDTSAEIGQRLDQAEIAFRFAAQLADLGIASGLIQGSNAVAVRNLIAKGDRALAAARAAHAVLEQAAEISRLAEATAAVELFSAPVGN